MSAGAKAILKRCAAAGIMASYDDILLLRSQSGCHFVERQSQADPNMRLLLGEPRTVPLTDAMR